jgi:hypothetical protein
MSGSLSFRLALKVALKRGALIAAANWPVSLVQSVADSLFKLLIAAPLLGGVFLVALVVGAEPGALMSLGWRQLAATIVTSLLSHPLVLTTFLLAMAVVVAGGSLFVFLVKGGTVGVLVVAERMAGPVEVPPLQFEEIARAAKFSIEVFVDSARALFPRYARLGLLLMAAYACSGGVYLALVYASRTAGDSWGMTAMLTVGFVLWITGVNLLYLLVQLVIAADDCSVGSGIWRVMAFLRHERRAVAAVFGVILGMVVLATGASLVATAALGLIAFIPFVGLAVLPLQLLAWLFRDIVFQYMGVSSIGAYLKLYREYSIALAEGRFNPAPSYVGWGRAPG